MENDSLVRNDVGSFLGGAFSKPLNEARYGSASFGHAPTHVVDTNAEEAYWRQNYSLRPYVTEGTPFIEYRPAYRYGADAFSRYPGRTFDHAAAEMSREWDSIKGTSSLTWEHARDAARDAWQRVSDFIERAIPGDGDHDGK